MSDDDRFVVDYVVEVVDTPSDDLTASTHAFKFDPNQPRDRNGRWTDSGDGIDVSVDVTTPKQKDTSSAKSTSKKSSTAPTTTQAKKLVPAVIYKKHADGAVIAESPNNAQRMRWDANRKKFIVEKRQNDDWQETATLTKSAAYNDAKTPGKWNEPNQVSEASLSQSQPQSSSSSSSSSSSTPQTDANDEPSTPSQTPELDVTDNQPTSNTDSNSDIPSLNSVLDDPAAMEDAVRQIASQAKLPSGVHVGNVTSNGNGWQMSLVDDDGNYVASFDRKVKSPTRIRHSFSKVDPKWQRKGIASAINSVFEQAYRDAGFTEIELDANSGSDQVGGYAWARAGYDWRPGSVDAGTPISIITKLQSSAGNSEQLTQWFNQVIQNISDPTVWPTPKQLAEYGKKDGDTTWPGRDVMENTNWPAIKYLNKDEIVAAASALVAAADVRTGAMIALKLSDTDAKRLAVEGGEDPDQLHLTLGYLGDAALIPVEVQRWLVDCVSKCVAGRPTVVGNVFAIDIFNPQDLTAGGGEPCVTLGVSGDQLETLKTDIMWDVRSVFETAGLTMHPQHRPWIPHITLIYTSDADLTYFTDRVGPVTFDAVRLAFADDTYDIPLGESQTVGAYTDDDNDDGEDDDDLYASTAALNFDPDQKRGLDGRWIDSTLTSTKSEDLGKKVDENDLDVINYYVDDNGNKHLNPALYVRDESGQLRERTTSSRNKLLSQFPEYNYKPQSEFGYKSMIPRQLVKLDHYKGEIFPPADPAELTAARKKLSLTEKLAVKTWSSGDYIKMNGYLRGKTDASVYIKSMIKQLRNTMTPTPADMSVTRHTSIEQFGVKNWRELLELEGKTIRDDGFMATTLSDQPLELQSTTQGSNPNNRVTMTIDVPKGTSISYLGADSFYKYEREALLPPGTELRINKVYSVGMGNAVFVHATVVKK